VGRDVVHCIIASRHPSASHPVERSFLCRCLRYHLSLITIPDSSGTQGPVVFFFFFWGGGFGNFGGNSPPEMPRINTGQVDVQLNSTMRLIFGTLRSTPLPWLPVLSNIELQALRRKAATDKLVEKIVKHDSWPIQPDILSLPLLRLTSRKQLWLDLQPMTSKVGGITGSRLRWSTLT